MLIESIMAHWRSIREQFLLPLGSHKERSADKLIIQHWETLSSLKGAFRGLTSNFHHLNSLRANLEQIRLHLRINKSSSHPYQSPLLPVIKLFKDRAFIIKPPFTQPIFSLYTLLLYSLSRIRETLSTLSYEGFIKIKYL